MSSGNQINAADLNQLVNLLNGTTTGVGVLLQGGLQLNNLDTETLELVNAAGVAYTLTISAGAAGVLKISELGGTGVLLAISGATGTILYNTDTLPLVLQNAAAASYKVVMQAGASGDLLFQTGGGATLLDLSDVGALAVTGNLSTGGTLTVSGTSITANGNPAVIGTSAVSHAELYGPAGSVSVSAGGNTSVTFSFSRAFTSTPAIFAMFQNAGNGSNPAVESTNCLITTLDVNHVIVQFNNANGTGGNSTLQNFRIWAVGE